MARLSFCQKTYFDRMAGVTKAAKTSNSTPKCMWILERGELRSKSKSLAQQAFLPHPSKIKDFCHLLPKEKALTCVKQIACILTVGGFFDTLKAEPNGSALSGTGMTAVLIKEQIFQVNKSIFRPHSTLSFLCTPDSICVRMQKLCPYLVDRK